MVKVLILCRKNETTKFLINAIISKISVLRIVGVANNQIEAQKMLEETKPNLIISSNKIIFSLIKHGPQSYLPRIILISKDANPNISYRYLLTIPYNLDNESMKNQINEFINEYLYVSKKDMLQKILFEIGFNLKLSGTLYLIESILYANIYKDEYSYEKLEKDVYTYVANKHKTTPKIVKWSIERSIRYLHESLTKESYITLEKYLPVEYPKKPTPKLVINVLSNLISY